MEVMALSIPTIRDVQLKEGGSVQKAELVFGDDTGEITVIGWRALRRDLRRSASARRSGSVGATSQMSKTGTLTCSWKMGPQSRKSPAK